MQGAVLGRLAEIVQGIALEQALSTGVLFGLFWILAGRRVGWRWILGASLVGSFVLWPNLVAAWARYRFPEITPSFFDIPDTSSPGRLVFELVMSDVLLVVLLNQFAAFAALLVLPAVLLAGAARTRYRAVGYGMFLAVLPLSWVLALLNEAPW